MDLTTCPECGNAAEIQWRDVFESTDGPVEHAKVDVCRAALVPAAGRVARESATPRTGGGRTSPQTSLGATNLVDFTTGLSTASRSRRTATVGADMDLTTCPECGNAAEITARDVFESTDGPIEHVKVVCVAQHWFVLPVAYLATARHPALEPTRTQTGTADSFEVVAPRFPASYIERANGGTSQDRKAWTRIASPCPSSRWGTGLSTRTTFRHWVTGALSPVASTECGDAVRGPQPPEGAADGSPARRRQISVWGAGPSATSRSLATSSRSSAQVSCGATTVRESSRWRACRTASRRICARAPSRSLGADDSSTVSGRRSRGRPAITCTCASIRSPAAPAAAEPRTPAGTPRLIDASNGQLPVAYNTNTITDAVNRDYAVPTYMALESSNGFSSRERRLRGLGQRRPEHARLDAVADPYTTAPDGHVTLTAGVALPQDRTGTVRTSRSGSARPGRGLSGRRPLGVAELRRRLVRLRAGVAALRRRPAPPVAPSRRRRRARVLRVGQRGQGERGQAFPGAIAAGLASPWGQAVPAGQRARTASRRTSAPTARCSRATLYEAFAGLLVAGDIQHRPRRDPVPVRPPAAARRVDAAQLAGERQGRARHRRAPARRDLLPDPDGVAVRARRRLSAVREPRDSGRRLPGGARSLGRGRALGGAVRLLTLDDRGRDRRPDRGRGNRARQPRPGARADLPGDRRLLRAQHQEVDGDDRRARTPPATSSACRRPATRMPRSATRSTTATTPRSRSRTSSMPGSSSSSASACCRRPTRTCRRRSRSSTT